MSKEWIKQRMTDPYYRKARSEGYRSRAAYKLKEIDSRLSLIKQGSRVLDVGAAPGGWSQVAVERAGEKGTIVAVDIIGMVPIPGVTFIPFFNGIQRAFQVIKQLFYSRTNMGTIPPPVKNPFILRQDHPLHPVRAWAARYHRARRGAGLPEGHRQRGPGGGWACDRFKIMTASATPS